MIAFELPDDRGPTRAQCRRDGCRASSPADLRRPSADAAEMRRRIRRASVVSLWVRGRLTLAQAASRAKLTPGDVLRAAWEGRT